MLNQEHPHEERLSALASHETDATADASLTAHVASCDRCAELVAELSSLRSALADLPDLVPSRPLRLLPEAPAPSGVDRVGGWARRFFAPALTAGAALAIVGLVGTATPALEGMASGGGDSGVQELDAMDDEAGDPDYFRSSAAEAAGEDTRSSAPPDRLSAAEDPSPDVVTFGEEELRSPASLPAERSPWPMVLFSGIALMIAAALMRWILAPRAG